MTMVDPRLSAVEGTLVELKDQFTLHELCQFCDVDRAKVIVLVEEGVLAPSGEEPDDWRFEEPSVRRARVALRLGQDFELGAEAMALVIGLLDEIEAMRSRLRRAGIR